MEGSFTQEICFQFSNEVFLVREQFAHWSPLPSQTYSRGWELTSAKDLPDHRWKQRLRRWRSGARQLPRKRGERWGLQGRSSFPTRRSNVLSFHASSRQLPYFPSLFAWEREERPGRNDVIFVASRYMGTRGWKYTWQKGLIMQKIIQMSIILA